MVTVFRGGCSLFMKQPQMLVMVWDDHFWLYVMMEMKGFAFLLHANGLLWIHFLVEYMKAKGWQQWCYVVNRTAGDYLISCNHCQIWDHAFMLQQCCRVQKTPVLAAEDTVFLFLINPMKNIQLSKTHVKVLNQTENGAGRRTVAILTVTRGHLWPHIWQIWSFD